MPVRHTSPSGRAKFTAMLRTAADHRLIGMPPSSAKRPNTVTRPA